MHLRSHSKLRMELGLATGCLTPKRGSLYFTTYFHLEREMRSQRKGPAPPSLPSRFMWTSIE